ncbi:MAG: hypothetical protein V1676_07545 [Candidatus Diapherotrites archaeon]
MNPLKLFVSPRRAVRDAYEKPNLAIAFVLVLAPVVFVAAMQSFLGLEFVIQDFAWTLASTILAWLAGGIILYILLYALKGGTIHGRLSGALSAFSLLYAIRFAIFAVFFAAIMLVAPQLPAKLSALTHTAPGMDDAQLMSELGNIPTASQDTVLIIMPLTFVVLSLLVLFAVYFFYLLVAEEGRGGLLKNLVMMVLFLGFLILINSVLGA